MRTRLFMSLISEFLWRIFSESIRSGFLIRNCKVEFNEWYSILQVVRDRIDFWDGISEHRLQVKHKKSVAQL